MLCVISLVLSSCNVNVSLIQSFGLFGKKIPSLQICNSSVPVVPLTPRLDYLCVRQRLDLPRMVASLYSHPKAPSRQCTVVKRFIKTLEVIFLIHIPRTT
jgi:hypothetical protein